MNVITSSSLPHWWQTHTPPRSLWDTSCPPSRLISQTPEYFQFSLVIINSSSWINALETVSTDRTNHFDFTHFSKTVTSLNYSIFFAHMYMSNSWRLPLRLSCWGQAVSRDVHTYKGLQAVLLLLTFIRPHYPVQRFMGPCRPCCYNRTWLLHI